MNEEQFPSPEPTIEAQRAVLDEINKENSQKLLESGVIEKAQAVAIEDVQNEERPLLAYTPPEAADGAITRHVQSGADEIERAIDPSQYTVNHQVSSDMTEFYSLTFGKIRNILVGRTEVDPDSTIQLVPEAGFSKEDVLLIKKMADELAEKKAKGELPDLTADLQHIHNPTKESETQSQIAEELKTMVTQQQEQEAKITEATSKILVAGSSDYDAAEKQRRNEEDPSIHIVELHYTTVAGADITLLGTEHTYTADNPEIQYLDQLIHAIPEGSKKVLILEGHYGESDELLPAEPAEAVKVGGEFGYMSALAKQKGIEVIPAEPDPHDTAKKILAERPDITRDELALHYALKTLVGVFRQGEAAHINTIAPFIHHSVGIAGDTSEGGWVDRSTSREAVMQLTDSDKAAIVKGMPVVVEKLNTEFAKLHPGLTLLDLRPDGTVTLLVDLNKQPVPWDPAPELSGQLVTKITEISRLDMLMRDRHTFELTMKALEHDQEPIVAVGSSHISALRPAFEAAF